MKVIALNGSPRKEGNTYYALTTVAAELKKEGIEVEMIHVGNQSIHGCTACYHCVQTQSGECVIKNDLVNECIQKIRKADGVLLGAPTYYANIPGTMKSFLDRVFFVMGAGSKENDLRHKIGAAVVAVRRSGAIPTFDALNHYLSISNMIVPGSSYWNVIHGTMPGDAQKDEEGIQTMRVLGQNMAYLLKMKEAAKDVTPSASEPKVMTNFIR